MVPAAGIERYAPTDNTQLIEKVRTQEPLNPLYARLLCTKSCTTKSGAAALLIDSGATKARRFRLPRESRLAVTFRGPTLPGFEPSASSLRTRALRNTPGKLIPERTPKR